MSRGQSHFFKIGLPFLTFMVLGHRALAYIGQGRYDVCFVLSVLVCLYETPARID